MPNPEFYTVELLLPADLYNRLDDLAAEECRSVDQQAYYLLRQHLRVPEGDPGYAIHQWVSPKLPDNVTDADHVGSIPTPNDPRRWAVG